MKFIHYLVLTLLILCTPALTANPPSEPVQEFVKDSVTKIVLYQKSQPQSFDHYSSFQQVLGIVGIIASNADLAQELEKPENTTWLLEQRKQIHEEAMQNSSDQLLPLADRALLVRADRAFTTLMNMLRPYLDKKTIEAFEE